MRGRREMFAIAGSQIEAERQRLVAKGYLGPVQAAVMRRGQLHAETEVRWHDEFAKLLAGLPPYEENGGQASELPGEHPEVKPDSHGDH